MGKLAVEVQPDTNLRLGKSLSGHRATRRQERPLRNYRRADRSAPIALGKGNRGVAVTGCRIALTSFPNMHRFAVCTGRWVVDLFGERPLGR